MPAREGPLCGIRVADFTWAWAGPQGSLLLSMLGAEVIKIESQARLDHARVHSLTAGSLKGGIDESPIFNDLNLGKRSLTLNLRKPEARDLVRRLVARSDVALQNMRPGVLDRMGLGYEDLRETKPDLIMLSSSAVGATGSERTYAGYAPTFACLSGIADISGHPDEAPNPLSGAVDLRVGTMAAFAVLAALIHRRRTGEGQHIDLSSTEVMSAMMGEAFVGYGLTGREPQRIGNRDTAMAPHGCYRCRGEGEWVSIAVADDREWRSLRSVVADPDLAHEDFATAASRRIHQERLDAIVERWTSERSPAEAVEVLQRADVAAAVVHSGPSLSRDPHVLARGVFETVDHPILGETRVVRPPWKMDGAKVPGPAPLLGQHNEYVLKEILGLEAPEIEALVESEVVY
jgi:benzylsuccinate CoA-transferase BbsF subunit